MKSYLLSHAIQLALPLIVGLLVKPLLDLLKRSVAWLDASPAWVKQASAFVLAAAVPALSALLDVPLPGDLSQWDNGVLTTLVGGLLGIALKQQKQVAARRER